MTEKTLTRIATGIGMLIIAVLPRALVAPAPALQSNVDTPNEIATTNWFDGFPEAPDESLPADAVIPSDPAQRTPAEEALYQQRLRYNEQIAMYGFAFRERHPIYQALRERRRELRTARSAAVEEQRHRRTVESYLEGIVQNTSALENLARERELNDRVYQLNVESTLQSIDWQLKSRNSLR
jgi:hypothetical protein